jgi:cytoskeletal protein CcmA (bactofilin family)
MSASEDPIASHFDEVTGLLYLEGQLDDGRARAISTHAASCSACNQLLHALERESDWLRDSLKAEDEAIPAHLIAAPERGATHWGWIAAFGLCAGGLYTLWTGLIQPSLARASQAGFSQDNLLSLLIFKGPFWKGWDAMLSLMEFLPVATLGVVGVWLLRRRWRSFTAVAFVTGAMAFALALPPVASAADVEHGNPSYTLPAGQEVKTDLIVVADRIRIDGDVDGDLIAISQNITVSGHVKGDILALGQEVRVNGPVDGNVRAWCEVLSLNSTVAKNVMGWNGVLELADKSKIGGTLTMFVGTSVLEGRVEGDLLARAGNLEINGFLGHDAMLRADRLTIGPTAEIVGQTKYEGRRQPDVAAGAKLGSPIQITVPKRGPDYSRIAYYWHRVMLWGASFLFGLVALLLAPGFFADAGQSAKRIGPAIGFGALFAIATPIAAIIVCATIVGLGIGIAAVFLYLIALYSGQIVVSSWLGDKMLGAGVGVGATIGRLALGLAVIRLLTMIPIAGALIQCVVVVWGLGAIVLAVHKRMRPQIATA